LLGEIEDSISHESNALSTNTTSFCLRQSAIVVQFCSKIKSGQMKKQNHTFVLMQRIYLFTILLLHAGAMPFEFGQLFQHGQSNRTTLIKNLIINFISEHN
jgi:hypothetical protein